MRFLGGKSYKYQNCGFNICWWSFSIIFMFTMFIDTIEPELINETGGGGERQRETVECIPHGISR